MKLILISFSFTGLYVQSSGMKRIQEALTVIKCGMSINQIAPKNPEE
jgi:hypothetical protein